MRGDVLGLTPGDWRTLLANTGGLELAVTSTSMKPTLMPGDQVRVETAGSADLTTGEIVVYERDGALICHRLLRNGRLRGDNCDQLDPEVDPEQIVGRVVGIFRDGEAVADSAWRRRINRLRFLIYRYGLDHLKSVKE